MTTHQELAVKAAKAVVRCKPGGPKLMAAKRLALGNAVTAWAEAEPVEFADIMATLRRRAGK